VGGGGNVIKGSDAPALSRFGISDPHHKDQPHPGIEFSEP